MPLTCTCSDGSRALLPHRAIGDLHSLTTPMDPQPPEPKGLISSWDENDVQLFFANLGLPQYEANVKG
jgi:hypothetical protein